MSSGGGSGGGQGCPTHRGKWSDVRQCGGGGRLREPVRATTGGVRHANAREARHSPPPGCPGFGFSPPPSRPGGRGWIEPTPAPTSTRRGRRPRGGANSPPGMRHNTYLPRKHLRRRADYGLVSRYLTYPQWLLSRTHTKATQDDGLADASDIQKRRLKL